MLQLKEIVKEYGLPGATEKDADSRVVALKGVSIAFRENEFVSILGQSGCGKTTLLNIIGGLDHYTSGDLVINGVSTKNYHDRDWDTYRNHSIGFVFQSYNLIPHQTVLANVELALTLSGVSKAERRQRAIDALTVVGLGNQLRKKPNQMSGGQMQRVAIARALVNNPDILLADEPTGALDTETSVQIMDLLKEVAKDRLVIMVTHNPDLAETYSTRIVRLLDGKIIDDSDPFDPSKEDETKEAKKQEEAIKTKGKKRTSMKYGTAFGLSMNNLMTKKGRTFLTAFAGSIGIIGISLILSLSNGVQEYINRVQEDTLSSYPLSIATESMDLTALMGNLAAAKKNTTEHDKDKIYSNDQMGSIANTMITGVEGNNLKAFKEFIESDDSKMKEYASCIQYEYPITTYLYRADTEDGITRVNPNTVMTEMFSADNIAAAKEQIEKEGGTINETMDFGMNSMGSRFESSSSLGMSSMGMGTDIFKEMIDDADLLQSQYDVVAGTWPSAYNEMMLIIDSKNEVSDFTLYALGLRDRADYKDVMVSILQGQEMKNEGVEFDYDEILGLEFKVVLPTAFYEYDEDAKKWVDRSKDEEFVKELIANAESVKITAIARPNEDAIASSLGENVVAYRSDLVKHVIEENNNSEIMKAQQADETYDVLAGLPFITEADENMSDATKADNFLTYLKEDAQAIDKAKIYLDYVTAPRESDVMARVEETLASVGDTKEGYTALLTKIVSENPDKEITTEDGQTMPLSTILGYLDYMTDEQLQQMLSQMLYEGYFAEEQEKIQNAASDMTNTELAAALDKYIEGVETEELAVMYDKYMPEQFSKAKLDDIYSKLQLVDLAEPESINIYSNDFDSKDQVTDEIKRYNDMQEEKDNEDDKITYTDMVALLMSSVSTIINAISYILIAFVAISLVVSSIMIGIITYISVLERTKEIGILRAIGASKKDIRHVFNAETILIGLTSGLIGVGLTLLMLIPINIIIKHFTDIANLARMPYIGAILLVIISMALTTIAGLFPAGLAAKKDPVEALRTE